MEAFTTVAGVAAPLPAANVDTDVIMPKAFLKGVDRAGLSQGVFHDLRFDASGRPDPAFVLNQPPWSDAAFLVVGPNFGCGSSREHAVWGLRQLGIRALIGTTFAGIFFDNCARNGLLALTLPPPQLDRLMILAGDPARNGMTIDLPAQTISASGESFGFDIDPFLKTMLSEGLDVVGVTLRDRATIQGFEQRHAADHPWLWSAAAPL